MNYLMMRKGLPDVLATFNERKQLIKQGCISAATAEAIMDRPAEQAHTEIFFVPSSNKEMPASCRKQGALSLSDFIELKPATSIRKAPTPITDEQRNKVVDLLTCGEEISVRRIAKAAGVSPTTVQRLKSAA